MRYVFVTCCWKLRGDAAAETSTCCNCECLAGDWPSTLSFHYFFLAWSVSGFCLDVTFLFSKSWMLCA